MSRFARKVRLASVAVIAVGALALAGCMPAADNGGNPGGGTGGEATGPTKLTLAQSADFKTLDPHNLAQTPGERVMRNVYSRLFDLDENMVPQMELATEYEQVDDLTWQFKIREDVTFQNGETLNAHDVVFSLMRSSSEDTLEEYQHFNQIDTVTALDDYTVEIKTDVTMPTLLRLLAKSGGDILPSETIEEIGIDEFIKAPIGSGPYQIKEWVPDDHTTLIPFEGFWGDAPKWSEVEVRIIPEASTRISELITGGVDLITDVPPTDWDRLAAEADSDVVFGDTTRSMMIVLRNEEPWITSDARVREAMDLAIDNTAITDGLFGGAAKPIRSRVPAGIFGSNPDLIDTYVYDPERAKKLIAEVEAESGPVKLHLTGSSNRYPLDSASAEIIASMLEEVGIEVELEIIEGTAFSEMWSGKSMQEGQIIALADGLMDAKYSMGHYLIGDPLNEGRAAYHNEEVSALITEANQSMDQDLREKNYQEALAIVAEERPHVFLHQIPAAYGASNKIAFTPRIDDRIYFDDIVVK